MGLEDTKSIDIVLNPTPHAQVTLVIVDGEKHADEQVRFDKFLVKLRAYIAYVSGRQFATAHPGVEPKDVLIGVFCTQPPNEMMRQIKEVRPHGRPDVSIRVSCVEYQPGDPLPWFVRPDGQPPHG